MNNLRKHKGTQEAMLALIVISLLTAAGCSKAKGTPPPPPPPDVAVVPVESRDVRIYREWIGTLDGMVNAQIKAQVPGYLLRQYYTDGAFVKKGQLLFEIDARPFRAALEQAQGQLAQARGQLAQARGQLLQAQAQQAKAEADQGKAQLDVARYTPLAKSRAVTQQDLENAVQANLSAQAQVQSAQAGVETAQAAIVAAQAQVQSAQAEVETAQLNLSFTKITSLIDGIAGIAQTQVGNLIGPNSSVLTTVSTVDPIKVYFTVSEQEYLESVRRNPNERERQLREKQTELELILADGNPYPRKGKFFVADREVNVGTGTIRLAGLFPNPAHILRPGQYGRIRAATDTRAGALLIPQRAVTEFQGSYRVAVVDGNNKVSIRPVKVGERVGSMWIIEDGLKLGERIVAEGTQKVRPDATVNPKPFAAGTAERRGE